MGGILPREGAQRMAARRGPRSLRGDLLRGAAADPLVGDRLHAARKPSRSDVGPEPANRSPRTLKGVYQRPNAKRPTPQTATQYMSPITGLVSTYSIKSSAP